MIHKRAILVGVILFAPMVVVVGIVLLLALRSPAEVAAVAGFFGLVLMLVAQLALGVLDRD